MLKVSLSIRFGGLFIFAALAVFLYPKQAQAAVGDVVISQIQVSGGSGLTANDFIELYNSTAAPVDIGGWKLRKTTSTGTESSIRVLPSGATIQPYSFFLWANSSDGFSLSVSADESSTVTITSGNTVSLLNTEESLQDSFILSDSGVEGAYGYARAGNIGNFALVQSFLTARNSQSPAEPPAGSTPAPNPTEPSIPAQLKIFISEVMPDPEGKDSGSEWIELFNAGAADADISNWILDDEGTDVPGTTSWTLPATVLAGGQYKVFYVPSGRFALNNDADSARLFNPDKVLVDQINYKDSEEGQAYAKDVSGWRWTESPTPGTPNQFIAANETATESNYEYEIVFNEVFGNPTGADSGREWVEFANLGKDEVDLSGWYLDDAGSSLSKNAYRLPAGSVVPAAGFLLISLPANSFTITNTEEELRLITPEGADFISIFTPEFETEAQSFARVSVDSEEWKFTGLGTPGKANAFSARPREVVISEIYFLTTGDDDGFIELQNQESEFVNLANWQLTVSGRNYIFSEGASVAPKSYLLLSEEGLNFNLTRNNYLELALARPDGQIQSSLAGLQISGAPRNGFSAVLERGNIVWTSAATPGQKNKIVRAAVTAAASSTVRQITASQPQASPVVSGATSQPSGEVPTQNELPIIIEEKSNRGFFHKIFAKVGNWLLK